MHKWVLVTRRWTSNLSMEVLENTENDLQIDHRIIDCCVIALTHKVQNLRTCYTTKPVNTGMFMNFPWAHIGVDAKSGLTHSLVTTAANEHDLNQLGNLLHGEEQFVSADAGYQGAPQREELAEVDVDWLIAERPGKVRTLKQHPRKNKTAINIEYMKASIRARVEHPFRIIKRQFGFVKARYKGLLKNDNQLAMLFTLANLFRADQMIRQWERSH